MASRNSKSRMIYWKISYCKQLARCSLLAQLLFTWLIPNTDDLGRMEGDPEIIKGMIFPYHHSITANDIEVALNELLKEELVYWYQVNGCWYIAFPKFDIYQKLRKDRVYNSDYPSPVSYVPTCHDKASQRLDIECLARAPAEVKRSEVKRSEVKKDYSLEFEKFRHRYLDFLDLIDKYFEILRTTRRSGKISDSIVFQVYEEMNKYPLVVVRYACSTVINKPDLHSKRENYFYGIMRNTEADEAEKKLKTKEGDHSNGNNTGDNKQGKFAGIDKSKFLAKPKA